MTDMVFGKREGRAGRLENVTVRCGVISFRLLLHFATACICACIFVGRGVEWEWGAAHCASCCCKPACCCACMSVSL